MPVTIPSLTFAHYETEITLDNTPFILERKWNSRGGFWVMKWYNRNRDILVSGLKIVINYDLIGWYPDRGLPPGQLFAIEDKLTTDRIGRDDFINGRLSLVYFTEAEVNAPV